MQCLTPRRFPISTGNEGMNQQILEISSVLSVDEGLAGFEPRPLREHYARDDLIHCEHLADGGRHACVSSKGNAPLLRSLYDTYFLNE